MSVARRLVGSFGASVLGPGVTLLVQLINVPVMLRLWGPELYGEWLMLSAIPTYLMLSDLGFGNVAGSAMTMRVHAGDRAGARTVFQSTMALVGVTSTLLAALVIGLVFLLPVQRMLGLHAMPVGEARGVLVLLSLNTLVVLQWSVLVSAYRATERYATGVLIVNLVRVLEGAGVFIILFTHARPLALTAYMVVVSITGTVWLIVVHLRHAPWLGVGLREVRWSTLRELMRPAFAFMAFPACAALSTQGVTLMVGLILGPVAVALFNPMRTLSRIPLQLTDPIKNSAWAELSAAFGRKDESFARRLHRGSFQASLLMAGGLAAGLWVVGPTVFRLWVHGRVVMDLRAFHWLLIEALVYSLWNTSSSVAMSVNRHERMSAWYLAFSAGSVVLVGVLARALGLTGVSLGMLFADVGMIFTVLRISTDLVGDTLPGFFLACLRPVELKALLNAVRRKRRIAEPVQAPEAIV